MKGSDVKKPKREKKAGHHVPAYELKEGVEHVAEVDKKK